MKRKILKNILVFGMAAVMSTTTVSAVLAAEADAAETVEAEDAADEAADFKIALTEGELEVKNETERVIESAVLETVKKEAKEGEEQNAEAEPEEIVNLVLTEKDGTVHTFEDVTADKWTEPVLTEEYEILYVSFKDENGKDAEAAEKAEEKKLEKSVTVWTSDDVNIRKEADQKSEALKVLPMGTECEVTAVAPGWLFVKAGELTGYVNHKYLTEDKAAVDKALEEKRIAAEEAARAAAEAAAQQAAWEQQQAQQNQQNQQPQEPEAPAEQPTERYEVSRENVPSCDDGSHGTTYITYSDGTVEAIPY